MSKDTSTADSWATIRNLAQTCKGTLGAREVVLVAVFEDGFGISTGTDAPSREMQRLLRGLAASPVAHGKTAKTGGTP